MIDILRRTGFEKPSESQSPDDRLPWYFAMIFLSLCVPAFFSISGLHLSFSRIILLATFPYLFFKVYSGRCGKVLWMDIAILLFIVGLGASIFVNNLSAFVTFVGSNAVIILGGYLAGRVFIRGPGAFSDFTRLFGIVVLLTLPFALYESQTSVMVIARLIDTIPMISSSIDVDYPPRNGLYRVQVLFTHPIHYGLFASMCFSLIFIGLRSVLSGPKRLLWSAGIVICCGLSVSSGPVLSLIVQVALIGYCAATERLKHRWAVLIICCLAIYMILEVLSTRPAYFAIVERISFNPATAYARKILLDYGLAQIARTPFLGVGYNQWDLPNYMTGSLDNYWLMTALVYGVPAFVFLVSAFLYALFQVGRADFSAAPFIADLRLGWALVIISLMFTLSTVAVWSDIATLVFMFLGSGAWMIGYKPVESATCKTEQLERRGPVYTRFARQPAVLPSRPCAGIMKVHRKP